MRIINVNELIIDMFDVKFNGETIIFESNKLLINLFLDFFDMDKISFLTKGIITHEKLEDLKTFLFKEMLLFYETEMGKKIIKEVDNFNNKINALQIERNALISKLQNGE